MTPTSLTLSYFALFDTRRISPREILVRLEEVSDDFSKDNVINQLVMEERLLKGEFSYKFGENIFTIAPKEMVPTLQWLFDTEEGHEVLDTLKPLYAKYDMEQTPIQALMTDFIRSHYSDHKSAHNIFRTDLEYLVPITDDQRFSHFIRTLSEGTFSLLLKDTIDNAYRHSLVLNKDTLLDLVNRFKFNDMTLKYQVISTVDLYNYLAHGYIDSNKKRSTRVPETHVISAVYGAFHGHFESALDHFREAQRLYNAKTAIIELRGIYPIPVINTLYTLTCAHVASEDSLHQIDLMVKRKDTEPVAVARVISKILRNQDLRNIPEDLRRLFVQGNEMMRQWAALLTRYTNRHDVATEEALNSITYNWYFMKAEAASISQSVPATTTDDTASPTEPASTTTETTGNDTTKPLLATIQHIAPWESTLNTLMTKLSSRSGNTTNSGQQSGERLAYYIENIFSSLANVRIQTITKSGAWGVGKLLRFHQFMALPIDQMQPGDILIRKRNENKGYLNEYKLTIESILPEMTEQSRLYVGRSLPYSLVNVTEEVPYLVVERIEDGFEIKSNVRMEDIDNDIIITSRGASSINFLKMTEEQRTYFSHLLSTQFFPSEAEDRLKELLDTLGKKVEIHSPLIKGGTTLETVEGTPMLTVQMRPKGKDAYVVTVFCRPLEGGKVQCRPGHGNSTIIDQCKGKRYCVRRDIENETEYHAQLIANTGLDDTDDEMTLDAFDLLPIIDYAREHRETIALEWPEGQKLSIRHRVTSSQWRATLKKNQNGWFELEGKLQVDENTFLTMQQLMGLMDGNRSHYIKLGDGEFMALSETLRRQLLRIDALATRTRGHLQMTAFTAALLDNSVTDGELTIDIDDELRQVRQRIIDLSDYKAPVPDTLNATLRDYQREGYEWIARLNEWGAGALLADDMGLGKTIQTITYLLSKANEGPQLVIAPASVAPNWMREFEKFAPSLHVELLNFAPNRSSAIAKAKAGDVIISTYALLLSVKEEITQKEWVTACLDEAHVIKNRGAKTSGVCMKLKTKNRIMLTGTPLQNHLGELWNLFQFVNPGLLGRYEDYGRRFITPIEVGKDMERKAELERIVKPFMLRRTKDTVLRELPEKTEIYQPVEMTTEEMAVYEVIRHNAEQMLLADTDELNGHKGIVSMNTLAEITRLRQAACSARLVDKNWRGRCSKLDALVEALEPIIDSGDAALVFSQFTSFLSLVREALDKASIPYYYIDGSIPVKERDRLVADFQKGGVSVFLISLKAGGLGLNLTRANYVFHLDPWWNPAIEQQATDRAHRIGQQSAVTVYHFLSSNTIEEKIHRLHERKRELSDSILDGTDMSGKLTGQELLELL